MWQIAIVNSTDLSSEEKATAGGGQGLGADTDASTWGAAAGAQPVYQLLGHPEQPACVTAGLRVDGWYQADQHCLLSSRGKRLHLLMAQISSLSS